MSINFDDMPKDYMFLPYFLQVIGKVIEPKPPDLKRFSECQIYWELFKRSRRISPKAAYLVLIPGWETDRILGER